MSLRINTNIAGMRALNHLASAGREVQVHMRRLSSGLRIVHASDDPAGLGISERMRAQLRSIAAATRNTRDGISMVQTAGSAIGILHDLTSRMKELSIQALNGVLTAEDRQILDIEYRELVGEFSRVVDSTEFNGVELLGSNQTVSIQTGIEAGGTVDVSLIDFSVIGTVMGLFSLQNTASASTVSLLSDRVTYFLSFLRSRFGAAESTLQSELQSLQEREVNLAAAESRIRDADVALEAAELTRSQVLQSAAATMVRIANLMPKQALQLLRSASDVSPGGGLGS